MISATTGYYWLLQVNSKEALGYSHFYSAMGFRYASGHCGAQFPRPGGTKSVMHDIRVGLVNWDYSKTCNGTYVPIIIKPCMTMLGSGAGGGSRSEIHR